MGLDYSCIRAAGVSGHVAIGKASTQEVGRDRRLRAHRRGRLPDCSSQAWVVSSAKLRRLPDLLELREALEQALDPLVVGEGDR